MIRSLFFLVLLASSINASSEGDITFTNWLEALKEEARGRGISEQTISTTFEQAEFLPSVVELDRSQPEFITTFSSYLNKRVTRKRINEGRLALKENYDLLSKVEIHYGIPKAILVAFWGLETNYGNNRGNYGLPSSLMTLAYEGRRAEFFRSQLMDMMHIVDAGHNKAEAMRGSWAGAMGHMQFMPSTFLAYAIDSNADGRSDIWHYLPDAFFSAANYLSSIGWQQDEPIALEVKLPADFEYYQAQLDIRQNSRNWAALGVVQVNGNALPTLENSALVLPQGWQGPAFLVASNFDVIMKWNRSVNYALSVSHLADQLYVDKPLKYSLESQDVGITFNQAWAMQEKLNKMGYDSGKPDGLPGRKTKEAIRNYQLSHHLPADGHPSIGMFEKIMADE